METLYVLERNDRKNLSYNGYIWEYYMFFADINEDETATLFRVEKVYNKDFFRIYKHKNYWLGKSILNKVKYNECQRYEVKNANIRNSIIRKIVYEFFNIHNDEYEKAIKILMKHNPELLL